MKLNPNRCGRCEYFSLRDSTCRCRAPVAADLKGRDQFVPAWPRVAADDFCGEFRGNSGQFGYTGESKWVKTEDSDRDEFQDPNEPK